MFFSFLFTDEKEPYLDNQKVVAHKLDGLIISGDHFYPPDYIINTTKGVLFYRTSMPENSRVQDAFCARLEKSFLEKVVTQADLERWKEEIANYFLENCNTYVFVEMMVGANDSSIIVLKVMESKIGEVLVSGNKWFSDEYYRRNMGLFPEGEVDTRKLTADLDKLNRNPSVKAELVFHKEKGDRINVELMVEDSKPFSAYSGVDNQLVDVLCGSRIYGGGSWQSGGALPKSFSMEYNMSMQPKYLQRVLLEANVPLKYGAVGLSSDVAMVSLDKVGYVASLTQEYSFPLLQRKGVERALFLSVKQKAMNTNALFGEQKFGRSALIAGVELGFCGSMQRENYFLEGSVDVFSQPFAATSLMSETNYDSLRQGAATTFTVGRGEMKLLLEGLSTFPSLFVKGAVQVSFTKLLPCEQFGLGGEGSVRGYAERAINADSAALLSVEARSPKISLLSYFGPKYRKMDRFYGVLFVDSAEALLETSGLTEGRSLFMLGMGPGFRYDVLDTLHASLDLGMRFGRLPLDVDGERARLYFSVAATY